MVVDDIAGFDESQHVSAFAGKDDVRQGKGFKDIGKPFFASFGAFGNSLELTEIVAVEGYD
jgi:hypothetical protein